MDLSNSDLLHPKTSLLELTYQFAETLSHFIDNHAPKQTKMTQLRPPSQWMSLEIRISGKSLASDSFPSKQALVTLLIKKKTLCRNELKNYHPISNLSFLSKILEKIVAKRLNAHIEEQLLSNHEQSAYKRFHSTETALLTIHNDIICNMDNGKVTTLKLLDLSAAFDAIDHLTLLERLHGHFGISGIVFHWFK